MGGSRRRVTLGRIYDRNAPLDEYGGQRYGGIITPAQHPLVFLQTGSTGRPHGYNDYWDPDAPGVFHYYGEGQVGDVYGHLLGEGVGGASI